MKVLATMAVMTMLAGMATSTLACNGCGSSAKKAENEEKLSTEQMSNVVETKSAAIVDARGMSAKKSHIPGAKLLSTKSSEKEIKQALPNKDEAVVTYCGSTTCSASPKLAQKLKKMGYTNVREYPEGIAGWKDAGKEIASK